MDLFPKTLKLYHFLDKNSLSLSIKSSGDHVVTFWMNHDFFQQMIIDSYTTDGFSKDRYFVYVKEHYVRFSKSSDAFATHFRICPKKWAELISKYNDNILLSHSENHFSCEVV